MINLRIINAREWVSWRDLRLAALKDAPYAFTSDLAEWEAADDERWIARLNDVALNMIADLDGCPAGMVSAGMPDATGASQLISMWVTPGARGRKVADVLVDAVIDWARVQGSDRVVLWVASVNDHAVALYRRHGFVDVCQAGQHLERQMVRPIVGP